MAGLAHARVPSGLGFVNRLRRVQCGEPLVDHGLEAPAEFVGRADGDRLQSGQDVQLGQRQFGEPVDSIGVAQEHQV